MYISFYDLQDLRSSSTCFIITWQLNIKRRYNPIPVWRGVLKVERFSQSEKNQKVFGFMRVKKVTVVFFLRATQNLLEF